MWCNWLQKCAVQKQSKSLSFQPQSMEFQRHRVFFWRSVSIFWRAIQRRKASHNLWQRFYLIEAKNSTCIIQRSSRSLLRLRSWVIFYQHNLGSFCASILTLIKATAVLPVVNFPNILWAAFALISLQQKNYAQTLEQKSCLFDFRTKKAVHKMLVKLTPVIYNSRVGNNSVDETKQHLLCVLTLWSGTFRSNGWWNWDLICQSEDKVPLLVADSRRRRHSRSEYSANRCPNWFRDEWRHRQVLLKGFLRKKLFLFY